MRTDTHVHHYDEVTHHCQCGAYRFEGFVDRRRPEPEIDWQRIEDNRLYEKGERP